MIAKLISTDQSAHIQKRYICFNVRLVQDIVDYSEMFNYKGILLCLDFEKAFDTVNWDFILKTLEKYGFSQNFSKWIKTLHFIQRSNTYNKKNNGWLSKDVKLYRGIRQGCPLSALLFILAVEILDTKTREDKDITGYKIKEKEVRISQYEDDSTI